jgi:hypothetical protein
VHWVAVDDLLGMVLDGKVPHAGSSFAVLAAKVRGLL